MKRTWTTWPCDRHKLPTSELTDAHHLGRHYTITATNPNPH